MIPLSLPAGVKIIFRVGLVLLKCMLGTQEKLKACQGQYETMELLRNVDPRYMQEGFLVREVGPNPHTTHSLDHPGEGIAPQISMNRTCVVDIYYNLK